MNKKLKKNKKENYCPSCCGTGVDLERQEYDCENTVLCGRCDGTGHKVYNSECFIQQDNK